MDASMFCGWRLIGFLLFAAGAFGSPGWADDYYKNAPPCVMADGGPERDRDYSLDRPLGKIVKTIEVPIKQTDLNGLIEFTCVGDKIAYNNTDRITLLKARDGTWEQDIMADVRYLEPPVYYKGKIYFFEHTADEKGGLFS
jgi:hypothetical protein